MLIAVARYPNPVPSDQLMRARPGCRNQYQCRQLLLSEEPEHSATCGSNKVLTGIKSNNLR